MRTRPTASAPKPALPLPALPLLALLALALLPGMAHAHADAVRPGQLWRAWTFDPVVVLPMAAAMLLYARGVTRLWAKAGAYRGVQRWQAWCFAGGMLLLALALVAPLHALGGSLFAAHMSQHVLMMTVAAPLLVMGAPVTAWTWALPPRGRKLVSGAWHGRGVAPAWRLLRRPAAAWLVHAAAIWVWHIPSLYSATVTSDMMHTAQHLSFMGAAVLFWYSLQARSFHGAAVIYLLTTAMHSSLLGALLAFSPHVYYAPYAATAPLWGLSALEDQQIGGFIMWVPAGGLYFAAALVLLASWLRTAERRAAARRSGAAGAMLLVMVTAGCSEAKAERRLLVPGGDVRRGQQAILAYGCGSCHEIKGIRGATGKVGPTLTGIGERVYIAGSLPNTPEMLMGFIMSPTSYRDPTAMPELGVTAVEARDMVAYLYSIR
jgi:putative membrane protein